MGQIDWWKGAVIYQIYPRSYKDSNGDGIGDLPGITETMPYVASLGVDAIWISPFFKSPMKDYGYDVSDYRDVDPIFGTLADFDTLLKTAHDNGLKVIVDMVMSHTSDRHDWFVESRNSRDNPKADWYVWADAQPDGSPPNNWQSVFGGSAWTYNLHRGQYYLHNFLTEQPDLNLWNPEVQDAILNEARFWLDRGVDGFRLDALNFGMHDRKLRDNPPAKNPKPAFFNIDFPTTYTMQQHVHSKSQPEMLPFLERIRALLDEYENRMAVAEIGDDRIIEVSVEYTYGPKRLHTAYNFSLISGYGISAEYIKAPIEQWENEAKGKSWPSWAFSNHDVERIVTRWGGEHEGDPRLAKVLMTLLLSIKGNAFIYQGEELGLPDAHIPYDRIEDPWGLYLYPKWQGRDGARTPFPWTSSFPDAGFSGTGKSWLPIDHRHFKLSKAMQDADKNSVLNVTRRLLAWRKEHDAMRLGDIRQITCHENDKALLFERFTDSQSVLCAFNLSHEPLDWSVEMLQNIPDQDSALNEDGISGRFSNGVLELPAFGFCFLKG